MRTKKLKVMVAFLLAIVMVLPALSMSATGAEVSALDEDNRVAIFDLQAALEDVPVGTVIDGYLNGIQPAGPAVLTVVEREGQKAIRITGRTEGWHALDVVIGSFALDWYPGQSYDFAVSGFTTDSTMVQTQITGLWQPMIGQGTHNGAFTRTHPGRVLTAAQGNAFTENIRIQTTNTSPFYVTEFTVVTTPRETDWHLVPSLWEQWEDYFMIGSIDSTTYNNNLNSPNGTQYARDMFVRHFNLITGENNMKPDTYGPQASHPTHNTASAIHVRRANMLAFSYENNIPIHGHTFLWHSQSATWMTQTGGTLTNPIGIRTRAEARANMEIFIRGVAQLFEVNYPGQVIAWDVINEAFTNGNGIWRESLRENVPWFLAYANGADAAAGEWGGDYIYDAFVFARRYAPSAVLVYNDYNMDTPSKFSAVADMVRELNAQWALDTVNNYQAMPELTGSFMDIINAYKAAGNRLLIETVGFQSHYHVGANFRHIEDGFQLLVDSGVNIAVTELDVAIPNTPWWGPTPPPTEEQYLDQGRWVAELMQIHRRFGDYMDNVSVWGFGDRHSWLNGGDFGAAFGLPFDHSQPIPQAKPMFWAMLEPDRFIAQYGRYGDDGDGDQLVRQFSFAPRGTPDIANFDLAQWQVAPAGWARNTSEIRSNRFVDNTTAGATGLTRALWDDNYLYVRVEVAKTGNLYTHANPWENDSVEVFFSESRNRTNLFRPDGSDGQYRVNFNNVATFDRPNTAPGFASHVQVNPGEGYIVQMRIPFRLGTPRDLQDVGFDVQINTGSATGRTGVAVWSDLSSGGLWQSPAPQGQLTLSETPTPIRPDHIAESAAVFGSPTGIDDPIWADANVIPVNQWTSDAMVRGATGVARTMWDENFLYAIIDVTDCLIDVSNGSTWLQDSVEFCLDLGNVRGPGYPSATNGGQYRVTLDGGIHTNPGVLEAGVLREVRMTPTGYIIFIGIPIGHRNFDAEVGANVSFDIQINDAANGTRFGIATWSDSTASGFSNSTRFGHLRLLPEGYGDEYVWRLADPNNIQIGREYVVVSEYGALTNEGMVFYRPAEGRADPLGMTITPVTTAGEWITSEVTPNMIWQFGPGNNVAAAAGGLGEGPGFHLLNDAPGTDAGRFPLRRDGSLQFPTAPIMTTSMAVPNNQSLLLHVLDEEERTVSLYFWSGNNAWNFALEGTEEGFTARGASSNAAQLMPFLQNAPLRLYERVQVAHQHAIVATAGANGSISPTSLAGHVWVDAGANQTFTFTPAFGFAVDTVTVDGEPVSVTNNTFTFENVTANHTIHVTFRVDAGAVDIPFIVYNDIFAASGIVPFVYTTAVIIDVGEGNSVNLADISKDMFTVSARNTRLNGTTLVFEGDRTITRAYVNTEPVPLGYIAPYPGSPDLVTATPASGRYIILELEFWGPGGPILAARADDGPNSTILNYRINMDRNLTYQVGGVTQSVLASFEQDRVVTPAIDRFVPDRTNPGGAGDMRILIAIHEAYQEEGPLPLFIYNHGGGRSGPAGEADRFGPLMTLSGAAVLSKLQLEHPGRFDGHIIATQGHANNQANRDALIAYVEELVYQGIVDPNRIYMSGFSMGSMYTLGFLVNNPEFLAAVIPIGGGTMPTQAQINANPGILDVAIWPQMHIRDGMGGRNWTNYFSTGLGATAGFREANVSIFETHTIPVFPFFGWSEGNNHETEGAAFAQVIGTKDLYFAAGAHEKYADLYIFDWLFDQCRSQIPNYVTFNLYTENQLILDAFAEYTTVVDGRAQIVVPVVAGTEIDLGDVLNIGNIYGIEGRHGYAFWGWFDAEALDGSGRRRAGLRRPALAVPDPDADVCMLASVLAQIEDGTAVFVNRNLNLYGVWVRWGDVDDNGAVNMTDLNVLQRHINLAHMVSTALSVPAADVVVDGQVNSFDLSLLQRHVNLGHIMSVVLGAEPQ